MKPSASRSCVSFHSLEHLCETLGATNKIKRVLVSNNGLAALKGMDSIRSWLYEHISDPEAIQFVVMATPEDLKANAEYISMADQHVSVPGGPNTNNYANVDVIMHTALQNSCDAIYPGWGHASENPALPRECEKSKKVLFLGPTEEAMFSLGDKIASTIVAQSNDVPTVPWSGDSIRLEKGIFTVDSEMYDKAYVTTPEECERVCRRVGFPVMIKASEGGGGKGIRCCDNINSVKDMFFAVSEEVKGCHIFVMRMLKNVRHLEVQLLADNYGNCIAIRTRDCSVQRRHQKIIEEGPVFGVEPHIIRALETSAVRLAKAVNYRGLGTVEYMYDKDTHLFYFLELNPRIQVEHPVSELISGVNLPAALLCVGMGIRLDRIPEVRTFFGKQPYDESFIDFEKDIPIPSKNHTIAVRVTAEDTDEGFRPTSGIVEEIAFKNSKECWGYFSIGSGGEIHQYADSQFGHIFSSGASREDARRSMVLALRNLLIRGEIRTSSSFVLELLETPEFRDCDVNTQWLDSIIARRENDVPRQHHSIYVALIAACIFRNVRSVREDMDKYAAFLTAGHTPSTEYLSNYRSEAYISKSVKYIVSTGRVSESEYALALNGSIVTVPSRLLKSGALQLTVGGKAVVAYGEKEPNSLRITIGGKVFTFTGDVDPTKILSTVPGRLVRYVIENGGHINEGGTFAEVEVMKMVLPLRSATSGVLHHRAVPGSTISMGILLAEITPDDPTKVSRPEESRSVWPKEILKSTTFERLDGLSRARRAVDALWNMLWGFHFKDMPMEERLRGAFQDLSSLSLSSVSLKALHFPFIPQDDVDFQTPHEKLRTVLNVIILKYAEVEKYFHGKSRVEAIQLLNGEKATSEVFELDFAHNQECHHGVIKAILAYLEQNDLLLKSLQSTLEQLVVNSLSKGSLTLQARYLLRQCSLPSFVERKIDFSKQLEEGSIRELVKASYGYDLMCSIMFDRQMTHLIQICLDLYIQREHSSESTVYDLDIFQVGGCWTATYSFEEFEGRDPVSTESFCPDSDCAPLSGKGICLVFSDEQRLRASLAPCLAELLMTSGVEEVFCTIFLAVSRDSTEESVSKFCSNLLKEISQENKFLSNARSLSFMVHGMPGGPHVFTFQRSLDFEEDTLIRNLLPQSARRLELHRLSNYDVAMYPTPFKDVHVFRASPKKKNPTVLESRMFARVSVGPTDMGMEPWVEATVIDAGRMIEKCLSALEVARDDGAIKFPASNHVFIKLVELTFDVSFLKHLLQDVAASYKSKFISLGVIDVELSFQVRVASGLIPFRVTVSSPTGYSLSIHTYYESYENGQVFLRRAETSEDVTHARISVSSDSVVGSTQPHIPSSPKSNTAVQRVLSKLDALKELLPSARESTPSRYTSKKAFSTSKDGEEDLCIPLIPYPLVSPQQVKRLQARFSNTTYVHDWPALLELLIRKDWEAMCAAQNMDRRTIPKDFFKATEMFLSEKHGMLSPIKDQNFSPCGMIVWIVEYAPASYFSSNASTQDQRRLVMVANDITFQSGSFAVPEDAVFCAASELAREQRIPFVYISANSGARLGLSQEVKKLFRVAFTPQNDIEYLYLLEEDYKTLSAGGINVSVEERTRGNEKHFVIKGIIGSNQEYLGVENLRGSGLIAGQMSKNYSEIPTISIVSGRSVGIGAYLNRLGRRIIQTADSPLILTGSAALNRLLGKEVYNDNSQLGGRQIMVPNGITHWNTKHDYNSARVLLRWLDYVPPIIHPGRCTPRILTLPIIDPIDRDVSFVPTEGIAYDPRFLLAGQSKKMGLFDCGSWMETLQDWAKSVVVGRATLGGIPCGIIAVETRLTKKFNPADPADPTSSSSFVAQAGQVWFPDSARKTADALEDFHREHLPCFIFANWRGFSGGMRDMYDEVLKFGASIVDNLRTYEAPVFIYIPPYGELRGGAWVVVDPVINHHAAVEMYCDPTARGGILEPSGVVEIKYRDQDVRELIRRCHGDLFANLSAKEARERENAYLPQFRDVAVRFADLHDNCIRMKATEVVQDVIPWKDARRIFHKKLLRKLKEMEIITNMVEKNIVDTREGALTILKEKYASDKKDLPWGSDEGDLFEWLNTYTIQEEADERKQNQEKTSSDNDNDHGSTQELEEYVLDNVSTNPDLVSFFKKLFQNPDIHTAALRAMENPPSTGSTGL